MAEAEHAWNGQVLKEVYCTALDGQNLQVGANGPMCCFTSDVWILKWKFVPPFHFSFANPSIKSQSILSIGGRPSLVSPGQLFSSK